MEAEDQKALNDELVRMAFAVDQINYDVAQTMKYIDSLQVEARCPECHKISYVDPPEHYKHRKVDCAHCGHFFWLGAMYVAADRVDDLTYKLTKAQLDITKGKG